MDKAFLSLKGVAQRLGISEKTVYRMLGDNQIPFAVKIGGQWRFKADAVESWINSQIGAETGRGRVHPSLSVHEALQQGAVLYRIHGADRDEVIDEVLSALPYSAAFDRDSIKVSIFAREALVSSSLKGIACMGTSVAMPVYFEKTMVLLAFLEEPMDFRALDGVKTEAIFLVMAANDAERARIDMKLNRLLMEDDFINSVKKQMTRRDLLDLVRQKEKEIFKFS